MTAGIRRVFHRFVLLTLPAALAGTLTIGTLPAQAAAQAKSSKAQPAAGRSSESKSSKTRSKSAAKQGPKTGRVLQSGMASWYGPGFHGRKTANGERFDKEGFTAAHKTLPIPSYAKVTNLANGKSVVVRINDRGPFAKDRVIDLSKAAANALGFKSRGQDAVVLREVLPPGRGADMMASSSASE